MAELRSSEHEQQALKRNPTLEVRLAIPSSDTFSRSCTTSLVFCRGVQQPMET